jgi:putative membrane protein
VTISLRVGLLDWQTDTLSLVGLALEMGLAAAYVAAALSARRNGRPWSSWRTAAFVAGLVVLATSLQSGFARYDDIFWVHIVQHQLLMNLAPALLMLGAPVILLLRVAPADRARRLVGVLHHRWLNWMNGPSAAIHLPLHYYGIMYVYLLTPVYALGERNEVFHNVVHVYFIGCGLMFWLPVLGRYPSRWHPAQRTKMRMVAIGLPVNLLLAALVAWSAPIDAATSRHDTMSGVLALVVGSVFFTLVGLVFVHIARPRRPERRVAELVALVVPQARTAVDTASPRAVSRGA